MPSLPSWSVPTALECEYVIALARSSSCRPFSDADWIGQTLSITTWIVLVPVHLFARFWQVICSDDSYAASQKEYLEHLETLYFFWKFGSIPLKDHHFGSIPLLSHLHVGPHESMTCGVHGIYLKFGSFNGIGPIVPYFLLSIWLFICLSVNIKLYI
jgi:hypothetical protein